ncbi:ferrochelatase [Deferribacter desulfuricans SSM1]|uniref:Ferrochelatase n=1 Tax=Deferribacter desulfuricans (strain DSM 14783 / JCM 11476 / NBRC 101012 / SSM1) TaxID=639282 RepID=D3PB47_DEFDS|nr:ferrochelatase [Deferribacter desulfuricans]BAI79820.1 ferrochelatase [Deferribacter desulfuricans SSM1]
MDLLYVMYMGGPDNIDGIEEFLFNLFSDRDIIDFKIGGLQKYLAKIIAKSRSKKVAPEYIKMGCGSPQTKYLIKLLEKVKVYYKEITKRELETEIGMCYYKPYIEETASKLQNGDYENIYIMTMYPQYSYTTSGVCFKRLFNATNIKPINKSYKVIPFWHLSEEYNKCIVKRIKSASERLGVELENCHLLYSAHSLPEYTLSKGDVYVEQLKAQIDLICSMLGSVKNYELAFQSRTGPIKWLGPETKTVIESYVEKRVDNIIVVPISFVSDHIETLIELDEQYIKFAKENGLNIERIESLNDSDDFAKAVVNILRG